MTTEDQQLMDQFEAELKKFYHELFTSQERLEPVFEKVLYDNLWELYAQ